MTSALGVAAQIIPRNVSASAGLSVILGQKFRIWDAHCHLGAMGVTPAKRAGELIAVAKRMGIEKVLISMGLTPHLANPKPNQLVIKNNDMMQALDAFPKETLGLVYVSPLHARESVAEINRCMKHPRVIGLKLWVAAHYSHEWIDQ